MTQPLSPPPRPSFAADLRDAIAPRTVLLVTGVLLLQLGFILSYIGAFHAPAPHRIPVVITAPAQIAPRAAAELNQLPGDPVHATTAPTQEAALRQVTSGTTSAALVVNPAGTTDHLYVASGGGAAVVTAVQALAARAEAAQHRHLTVTDLVPLQKGDARGLTGFYLVTGWLVGGYLVAALLGVAKGARPATTRRAVIRLAATVPYAIASGLGGALIVGPVLGALNGHFMALWWLGALLVLSAATVTMAFQVLFGVVGIGVTVLLFVVLGNPSAGGAYQASLLPPLWRALSSALPNGAGTDAVRRIVYFGAQGITGHLTLIVVYIAAGTIVTLATSAARQRKARSRPSVTDRQEPGNRVSTS